MSSLIKIETVNVTSAVSSVTLGAGNWDSSFSVYLLRYRQLETDSSSAQGIQGRFLSSGNEDSSANYDYAGKQFRAYGNVSNANASNQSQFYLSTIKSSNSCQDNGDLYLHNFNNASEYSHLVYGRTSNNSRPGLGGFYGGVCLTVSGQHNGIKIFMASGNIDKGTFTLYGLKK